MKKYITICTLLFIIFNSNLLFSQQLVIKYDNKYGVIAFNRTDKRPNYSFYYGINYLNKNNDNINGYLVPPILDHISIYGRNGLDLVDFEINNIWYRDNLLSDIVSKLNKILGVPIIDQYNYIKIELDLDIKDPLWTNYWNEIISNNKDLFANKGEFEKSVNYESRINAQKELKRSSFFEFSKKRSDLEASLEAKNEEIKKVLITQSLKKVSFRITDISNYDADNETYSIIIESNSQDTYG